MAAKGLKAADLDIIVNNITPYFIRAKSNMKTAEVEAAVNAIKCCIKHAHIYSYLYPAPMEQIKLPFSAAKWISHHLQEVIDFLLDSENDVSACAIEDHFKLNSTDVECLLDHLESCPEIQYHIKLMRDPLLDDELLLFLESLVLSKGFFPDMMRFFKNTKRDVLEVKLQVELVTRCPRSREILRPILPNCQTIKSVQQLQDALILKAQTEQADEVMNNKKRVALGLVTSEHLIVLNALGQQHQQSQQASQEMHNSLVTEHTKIHTQMMGHIITGMEQGLIIEPPQPTLVPSTPKSVSYTPRMTPATLYTPMKIGDIDGEVITHNSSYPATPRTQLHTRAHVVTKLEFASNDDEPEAEESISIESENSITSEQSSKPVGLADGKSTIAETRTNKIAEKAAKRKQLKTKTIVELRVLLKAYKNQKMKGNKAELIERLIELGHVPK